MSLKIVRKIAAEVVIRPEIQPRARTRHYAAVPSPAEAQPNPPAAEAVSSLVSYEVGYCKPPVATQFKPGQSGNPRGRPKGARGLNTIVIEKMTEKLPVRTARGRKKMAKVEVMVQQSIDAALGGNERERLRMLDRYSAAVPDNPILAPNIVLPADEVPAPPPEEIAVNIAMLDHYRAILAAQAGGE